jgi:hypothetical protein
LSAVSFAWKIAVTGQDSLRLALPLHVLFQQPLLALGSGLLSFSDLLPCTPHVALQPVSPTPGGANMFPVEAAFNESMSIATRDPAGNLYLIWKFTRRLS